MKLQYLGTAAERYKIMPVKATPPTKNPPPLYMQ